MKDYADINEAIEIIKAALPYLVSANSLAEFSHDSHGEYYMDLGQYEIMRDTENLIERSKNIIQTYDD